ncbi:MAG: response regulator [Candidatus Delongbacteria bacterium]|jgi:two-component system sensor histidine kinase/response regulator|nr:response regulator [Candidatus Delongbacteria bacterium]
MNKIEEKDITIMVVDDETINLQIVDGMLKLENYKSILITDSSEVLSLAESEQPDIILLDVDMPLKDGFVVCKELKGNPGTKNIPVLFLSGRSTTDSIIEGLKIGGVDYITKPFNAPELLARVNTHLQLKFTTDKLIEMENLKALHAAMVTQNHNLNQLTTSVLGQIEIGRILIGKYGKDCGNDLKECFNSMEKASIEMNQIIQKFKDIQTIEYKKYSNHTEMLDLDKSSIPEEE